MIERVPITYHQLQTFLAVARTGSLTKVARELNATQPTVSLQLRSLRNAFGLPLFERPGGRFRLTPAGERLRRYAEESLDSLRELRQDMAVLKGSVTGSLAVGITFYALSRFLPRAVPRFRARFPGVNLHVHVDTPEPLFAEIRTNTLDVACYLQGRTPPGLAVASLAPEELVIFASPQHPLAGRRHIIPAELSEHALVLSGLTFSRELFESKLRAVGVAPRVVSEAGNYDAVNELVDRNAGYTVNIKAVVAADIAAGRFVPLRLDCPPILGEIVAAYGARSVASPLIQEFIRFMRVELTRPPEASPSDAPAPTGRRQRTAAPQRPRRQR